MLSSFTLVKVTFRVKVNNHIWMVKTEGGGKLYSVVVINEQQNRLRI